MIHANHGGEITEYLLNQLKEASTDVSMKSTNCYPTEKLGWGIKKSQLPSIQVNWM